MSEKHVRRAGANRVVLTATSLYHRHGKNKGRQCANCRVHWTVDRDDNEDFHVWRNGTPADEAILDWVGNNVAVECC
ncbi:hypothetical protein FGE12_12340 [Aggregicoccus sp. 17bor-14]|uniref:hypothetical protein n=1 Tax=Myxococcaceae TaxID=31 RepID=UPI00129CA455|nr:MULTISPECIES: hypothetical protein [Myxococcaceae]MBF5043180.1 hypothetical protein [Simulacricoccus sp. 17bor-14]MRI88938.1 hypothetical protein [Aggregicoccus sp. 17bor-14]